MCNNKKNCSCSCSKKTEKRVVPSSVTLSENSLFVEGAGNRFNISHQQGKIQIVINENVIEDRLVDSVNEVGSYLLEVNENESVKQLFLNESVQKKFKELCESASPMEDKIQLTEAKINLKLTSNSKRELIKQAKTALDAIYAIYNVCEKQGIESKPFMKQLEKSFEGTNEMLTMLVIQDSIEKK